MTCTQTATAIDRPPQAMTKRVGAFARRGWDAYWNWQARRMTVRVLRSLDARTLRDIGLSHAEIESVFYGSPGDRRRRYHEFWRL
jgi:uncharacterized protein YjiS (DUF1127 family)